MPMVLGYIVLLALLATTMVTQARNVLGSSAKSQRFHAAAQAAQAAVNEYLSRLNENPAYLRYTHVPATNCPATSPTALIDSGNPFMGASFATLPGGTTTARARYRIDTSQLCKKGVVRLETEASVGGYQRRVTYVVKRYGFSEYSYFSDFESLDPRRYGHNPFAGQGETVEHMCTRHHDEATGGPTVKPAPRPESGLNETPGCATINWVTGDNVFGNMHTNDAMLICGKPQFHGRTTSSWNGDGTNRYLNNPGCGNNPNFKDNMETRWCGGADQPCYAPQIQMPVSNNRLKTVPGACVYSGPTRITFSNYGDKIVVRSPDTLASSIPAGCPNASGMATAFPSSGLIFVQDVPASQVTAPCVRPDPDTGIQNRLGYPEKYDITVYVEEDQTGCRAGDVFMSGTYGRPLTIAADGRIVLTNDVFLDQRWDADAMMGLISDEGIEVQHPVWLNPATGLWEDLDTSPCNHIQGVAMMSLSGSFLVQNYDKGPPRGHLSTKGAIIQKWRGLIGTTDGQHGYIKNFSYDNRMRFQAPPYFLEPIGTNYRVAQVRQFD